MRDLTIHCYLRTGYSCFKINESFLVRGFYGSTSCRTRFLLDGIFCEFLTFIYLFSSPECFLGSELTPNALAKEEPLEFHLNENEALNLSVRNPHSATQSPPPTMVNSSIGNPSSYSHVNTSSYAVAQVLQQLASGVSSSTQNHLLRNEMTSSMTQSSDYAMDTSEESAENTVENSNLKLHESLANESIASTTYASSASSQNNQVFDFSFASSASTASDEPVFIYPSSEQKINAGLMDQIRVNVSENESARVFDHGNLGSDGSNVEEHRRESGSSSGSESSNSGSFALKSFLETPELNSLEVHEEEEEDVSSVSPQNNNR